mgnify:CR=1 FL=1
MNRLLLSLLFGFSFMLYTNSISIKGNKYSSQWGREHMYAKSHNLENCLRVVNVSSLAYRGTFPMAPTFRAGLPPPPLYCHIGQEFYAQAHIEFSTYVTSC